MTTDGQAFGTTFGSWLKDRVELSFGADPDRHGAMTNGRGPALLDAIESFAGRLPFTGRWMGDVRRFAELTGPFGYFCKVDWCQAEVERLTVYGRYRPGSITQAALGEATVTCGFGWPAKPLANVREAFGNEPFLVGLRVDRDGRRHLSVYYLLPPGARRPAGDVVPELAAACGVPADVLPTVASDLAMLNDPGMNDRWGVEFGVQASEGTDEVRATVYVREIRCDAALRFVELAGAAAAAGRRLSELSGAMPCERFLYVGVRYDTGGRNGWKLYTLLRPIRPVDELALDRPPRPELLRSGFREPATGVALSP